MPSLKPSIFLILLTASGLLHAQDITLPLYPPGKIPNSRVSNEKEKWDSSDIVRISNVQNPDIAVFLPAKRYATGQAVIICPGGGYGILAYNLEGTDPAKLLNAKGIAAIVLKYRLPISKNNLVPHLSPLADAKRAMRMVRFHAAQWNIDQNKIGIMGFSAGGHLASTLGTHFDSGNLSSSDSIEQQNSRPDFMILVYPVISMTKAIMHKGSRNNLIGENPDSNLARNYSNELQVNNQTPPTFIIHASDDKSVPVENSLYFYQALKDHNVSVEMHIFPTGGHGFGLAIGKEGLEKWSELCINWINSLK